MGSYGTDGKVDFEKLKANLANAGTVKNADATTFPVEVTVDGQDFLVDGNGAVNKLIETANDDTKPYLPTGATVLESDLTKGVTIKDSNNNEWVWVEVPKSIYTDATYTVANNNTNVISSTDYTGIYNILNEYAKTYREGKSGQGYYWTDEWYDKYGTTYDGTNAYSQVKYIETGYEFLNEIAFNNAKAYYGTIYTDNKGTTEAEEYVSGTTYYAKITDKLTDTSGCGLTYSEYTKSYQKMLTSVYTNGGFYIGRYEAGIEGTTGEIVEGDTTITDLARTSHTDITSSSPKAISQKDAIPYNFVYCSEAQMLASKMTPDSTKTSSLMFGIQWDLVCKFLEGKDGLTTADINSDSTDWGNYNNKELAIDSTNAKKYESSTWSSITGTKSASRILLSTGASDSTSKMNIYDLSGNEEEWTLEHATASSDIPCAYRGGYYSDYGSDHPASTRYNRATTSALGNNSFRTALY